MKSKDRVTLYIATNATGSQKVPLSMIGNSIIPRCFGRKQEKRKLTYFDQVAWSDVHTFTHWFHEVILPHIQSTTNDKVMLIMDNCGPQGAKFPIPLGKLRCCFSPLIVQLLTNKRIKTSSKH